MCLFLAAKLTASSVPKGTAPDLQWSDALCGLAVSGGPASYTFNYSATPFSFAISRSGSNSEPIFNTAGTRLMFKVLWPGYGCQVLPSDTLELTKAYSRRPGCGVCPSSCSLKGSPWLQEEGLQS